MYNVASPDPSNPRGWGWGQLLNPNYNECNFMLLRVKKGRDAKT